MLKPQMFRAVFLSALLILLFGCASMDRFDANDRAYFSTVKDYTDRAEFYEGFINVFQMQATILNAKVLNGQLTKKADSFNWTDTQKAEEQAKVDSSLKTETTVFLSFFSPENKVNNLDSPSTIWRVFLDVNNKRYVGSVSTYVGFQNEARLFYPYHSVFAKAYLVKFPVPMVNIQDYPMTLTVTGTIGSDTLKFPALK
jgi:hypothetical protein